MKSFNNKLAFSISIFLIAVMVGCATSQHAANQKKYESSLDEMLVAVNNAIADAGLNMKGSVTRSDGSILITAVELTRQYGDDEPVQTMSMDIVVDKIDEKTVAVQIDPPNRGRYVMAGTNQTAESKFRESIFNSLEQSVGSIKSSK
ncbi:MAG: hypothetical protein JXR26_04365 [Balneolaceae bacterium]|nr:hypothetical protein [Balneolaceae bacterium]